MGKRQELFYEYLEMAAARDNAEWITKPQIARAVNEMLDSEVYTLNLSPFAHDVCSLMNTDRIAINANLDYEKIILVKDNKFKIATLHETIAEEKKIRARALKELWRGSLIKAKRLNDKQIIIDFETEVERVIETYFDNETDVLNDVAEYRQLDYKTFREEK